jgi:two-component system, chemotaxis family, sensor kinase CheA
MAAEGAFFMRKRFYIEDVDLVKIFVEEWNKRLDGIEETVLTLETRSNDHGSINDLFKRIHSVRGGSSFIGLSSVANLCRETESALEAAVKETADIDAGFIDSVRAAVALIKEYVTQLFNKLNEDAFSGEGTSRYIDFENEQQENSVLEGLTFARQNCEIRLTDNDSLNGLVNLDESDLETPQSEEFKKTLSEGIKEQFLFENTEHIERIENQFLVQLDKNEQDKDSIKELFRAVHSLKGGTGVYLSTLLPQSAGIPVLKEFSEAVHDYESALSLIRDKNLIFDKTMVDLSYEAVDYFKKVLDSVTYEKYDDLPAAEIIDKIHERISYLNDLPAGTVDHSVEKQPEPKPARVDEAQKNGNIAQSIRVSQEKLDKMMNTISELLITKNSFLHLSTRLNVAYNIPEISKEIKEIGFNINRISDELQNSIMAMRMVEIKTVFQKMPRVVRDISKNSGKQMELIMQGEETEIDKTITEQISDPLIHLIRNSADHGIESPDERRAKGKPEIGKIVLRAYNKNKYVYIEIEDDGNGIDAEKIKEKAIEKGFISQTDAEKMSANQLVNLIFLPGFSTAKKITEVSGRGVGMDIVKSNIEKIKGSVTIESELNKGTKMTIMLPLTLAVARGLVVEASDETYIFPLECIVETVKLDMHSIHEFKDKYFAHLRGEIIGVEWLCKIFLIGEKSAEKEQLNAVIISNGNEKFAIIVDKLKNEQEFVVKTFEGELASIPGISGSTLLGNGQVVLIINPASIIQLAKE